MDALSVSAGMAAFNALPPTVQTMIGKAAGGLVIVAAKPIGNRIVRWVRGSEEERAVERALRNAIALTLANRPELKDAGFAGQLEQPRFAQFVTEILHEPTRPANVAGLERELDDSIFDLPAVKESPEIILEDLRENFLRELRNASETRELYGLARLDQIAEATVQTRDLTQEAVDVSKGTQREMQAVGIAVEELAERLTGPGHSWATTAIAGMLREAREAFKAGRLDDAQASLQQQLTQIRSTEPSDRARQRHEQAILLSLAQISQQRGDRSTAVKHFEQARALGLFDERNRYLAGWVLINLGRDAEARALLDPHDGTAEWRSALAIACLSSGNWEGFQGVYASEQDVEEPDVVLALTRFHALGGDLVRADHFARGLLAWEIDQPLPRFRAVEGAMAVLGTLLDQTISASSDTEFWLGTLRRLFTDSDEVLKNAPPLFRLSVLSRRAEFHRLLLEREGAIRDFNQLVEEAPAYAVHLAANGIQDAEADKLAKTADAARDPIIAELIRSYVLIEREEWSNAANKLAALRFKAERATRNVALSLELECRAHAGEPVAELLPRVDEIDAPVPRAVAHASLTASTGDGHQALAVLQTALTQYPADVSLLRTTLAQTRALLTQDDVQSSGSALASDAISLADRLVKRLPCPEHRLLRAITLAQIGRYDNALSEVAEVADEGYETPGSLQLRARLALRLRRFGTHADSLLRIYKTYDPSPHIGLAAAQAAIQAGRYGHAEEVLDNLGELDDRELAIARYRLQAFAVEAQGRGLVTARDEAVRLLLNGYDKLDGPIELAGVLFLLAIGTPYDREVHERIARDHGSFANLPGVVAMPVDDVIELMKKEQEGARLRQQMFEAGVLPFQTFAELGPRDAAYLWFAYREGRSLMIVAPPTLVDQEDHALPDTPPTLLLDRTALLMMAEAGIIDVVFASKLDLAIPDDIVDWLIESEARLRTDYRPIEHMRLRELVETIETHPRLEWTANTDVDQSRVTALTETLTWSGAFDMALAERDDYLVVDDHVELKRVPADARERVIRSVDVLYSLVGRGVTYKQAAKAEEEYPSTFTSRESPSVLTIDRPLLLSLGTAEAWSTAGLLTALADSVPGVAISPVAERHLRDNLAEQNAYYRALSALTAAREAVSTHVESGRLEVIPSMSAAEAAETDSDPHADESGSKTEPADMAAVDKRLRGILLPVERAYKMAQQRDMLLWSDDSATHLYLDRLGPLVRNVPPVQLRSLAFSATYSNVRTIGFLNVLEWLGRQQRLSSDEQMRILSEMVRHGRAFLFTPELLGAASRDESAEARAVLSAFAALPSLLPADSAARFAPLAMKTLAGAIEHVWYQSSPDVDRVTATRRLLTSAVDWFAPARPYARLAGRSLWAAVSGRLIHHIAEEPRSLFEFALTVMTERSSEYRSALKELWSALDLIDRLQQDLPPEGAVLTGRMSMAVFQALQAVELDGAPVVPVSVLRLIAPRLGIDMKPEAIAEVTLDNETMRVRVLGGQAEELAAKLIAEVVDQQGASDTEPKAANLITVRVDAEVIGDEARKITIPYDAELLLLLPKLEPRPARVVLASLEAFYRESDQLEFASIARKYLTSTGAHEADLDWKGLYRDVLNAPSTWMNHDYYRAFSLLREAPFNLIRVMAGDPEPWRPGESLLDRESRMRKSVANADEFVSRVQKTWGPFRAAAVQGRDLARKQDVGSASEDDLESRARMMLWGVDPYARIFSWFALAAILMAREDLRALPMGRGALAPELDDSGPYLEFNGTYGDFLGELMIRWIRTEISPPTVGEDDDRGFLGLPETGPVTLTGVARIHTILGQLHVALARLVYRAIITDEHFSQARVGQHDGDPGGDLLVVGHELVNRLFHQVVQRASREGGRATLRELESVAMQAPLSQGRHVVGELFTPDAMGIGPGMINPYLTLLFAMLELSSDSVTSTAADEHDDLMSEGGESPSSERVTPFWWTPAVKGAVDVLSRREPPASIAYLMTLSNQAGVDDRFETLILDGLEERARRLMTRLGEPQVSEST